ncbi:hypothetical protein DSO57_1014966 [Entomophthora muscae]|uniref:Uncharacterized protein n=1 Tax=Entomophthora muscae TaxID=34485 RepID=A0ACC2UF43_9FUNG|nr:hypothetical protein DSO57_1014966 [Entomophthora muscae]
MPVVSATESFLVMLQHFVPAKSLVGKSEELPLASINCDHLVLHEAVQEMIKRYFQEHPAFLAAVCTTEEKQDPAEVENFAANKSASGYFLFYSSINNGQCCVLRRSTDTQRGILTLGLDLY